MGPGERVRREKLVTVAVIFSSAFLGSLFAGLFEQGFDFGFFPSTSLERKVEEFYALAIPGASVEVVGKQDVGRDMVKFTVKIAYQGRRVEYRELWVSKDGKVLTESVVFLEKSIELIKRMREFVECLYDEGVRIYGILNASVSPRAASDTTLQLNLLGRYSPKLYVSCDPPNMKKCMELGITRFPAVIKEGKVIGEGVKTVTWFEERTGCTFTEGEGEK